MRVVLVCTLALVATGCVVHEARVETPAAGPEETGLAYLGMKPLPIPSTPPPSVVQTNHLPVAIPVTWYSYRRDARGAIFRYDATVMTPLPWWQRFPIDLPVSMIPVDVTANTTVMVTPREVTLRQPEDIRAEAAAHGYAH